MDNSVINFFIHCHQTAYFKALLQFINWGYFQNYPQQNQDHRYILWIENHKTTLSTQFTGLPTGAVILITSG
ncbi:hypothetical protein BC355_10700 [Vibrio cholerae]|uniref:Uncharacterized protein n=1 Tax=Vibrio cholerae TaxID=666 RepID=A0A395UDP5_VIBCL|nr:hypothetical protein BC355_10700 [Vibrio cholerae]RGP88538.1 hypothetical protein BC353_11185 [Vibrio cholerae]RGP89777.1 hypothetical protein BC354_09580 [Vibrio cholerae]RGP95267.1 hypothetical protein BC352_09750 [Vibrio cholerae]TLE12328.1 hypothetical protein D2B32_12445 [Vibrio cholerae]